MDWFSAAFHAFIWGSTSWQQELPWRDQSACDIIFGFRVVCVSFRAYGLRWSIMAYEVRLSTETEVCLQKCNYIQIMVFPVVAIVKTDAGKRGLVEHWMIYAHGAGTRTSIANQAVGEFFPFLYFSQHWLSSKTPWSTVPQSSAQLRLSPRPPQCLPEPPPLPPAMRPLLAMLLLAS